MDTRRTTPQVSFPFYTIANIVVAILAFCFSLSVSAGRASAQATVNILQSFRIDGSEPTAGLVQGTDGNFYGTDSRFGPAYEGTVFKITRSGAVTTLHAFGDGTVTDDGSNPVGGLVQGADGDLYGTTNAGGSAGYGTVFKITRSGTVTILHSFGDGTVTDDGSGPQANLCQGTDGNFYGTTTVGGSASHGTVFKMTPTGTVTILHSFGGGTVTEDGSDPQAKLVLGTDGNFYSTTQKGGSASDGTVFKITPSGTVTILHSFGDGTITSDGMSPAAGLVQGSDGNFYGTTEDGGSGASGTVFKITPSGTVTILHSFGNAMGDGKNPQADLTLGNDGSFYGTTDRGGSSDSGTVFTIATSGTVTILHSFGDGSVDGMSPEAGVVQGTDGNFYGTTYAGGSTTWLPDSLYGAGTVFRITPSGTVTILHSNDVLPYGPDAGIVQGTDGNFYGTTSQGGTANCGTVFNITPSGTLTFLHSFFDGSVTNDGIEPVAALIQGTDGDFYGTTKWGGSDYFYGTIFKMTPSGTVTILHSFIAGTVNNDGIVPMGALVQGADGDFYGTTQNGGSAFEGTLFRITPSGNEAVLYSFQIDTIPNPDGEQPAAGLVQGNDGNFYGTTSAGGSGVAGTVFRMAPSGAETLLHSFQDGSVTNDGKFPLAALIQGTDGNFYGTTKEGGSATYGTIFKMTPSGTVTILHSFQDGSVTNDGSQPEAGLLQASDGNLYGTTLNGGSTGNKSAGYGTVFKITPSGALTILHSFGDGNVANDGLSSVAGLIQGADGNLYGTTRAGGLGGGGTVFSITGPALVPASLSGRPFDAQVGLSWSTSPNATSYNVYRGTSADGEGSTPFQTGITGATYTDTKVTNGTTYYYTVSAVDGVGTSVPSIEAHATPEPLAPPAPANLTAKAGAAQVVVTWTGSSGATSYNVFRAGVHGGETRPVATGIAGTSWTNTGLSGGKTYYFKVRAVNGGGTSGYSNEASATPTAIPTAPANLTAKAGNAEVTLSWTACSGTNSYEVFRAGVSGGETTPVKIGIAATSWTDTGLTNGKTYYFTVKAVNAAGTSAASNQVSATPE